jgi:hypothetical protein
MKDKLVRDRMLFRPDLYYSEFQCRDVKDVGGKLSYEAKNKTMRCISLS